MHGFVFQDQNQNNQYIFGGLGSIGNSKINVNKYFFLNVKTVKSREKSLEILVGNRQIAEKQKPEKNRHGKIQKVVENFN